jgi:hypothetical protein
VDAAEREMQVCKFVEEVWNGRNYEAVSDLYGETYVNPFGIGPAARAVPIRRYHEAFPDLHIDVEELVVAGDTVVLRAAFRGTDTGGYAGRAATGRTPSHDQRPCSFYPPLSFVAAIPAGPEPRSRWSASSEAMTNNPDGRRSFEEAATVTECG